MIDPMICPICHQGMEEWKTTQSFDQKRKIEYRRVHFRCTKDDTWGRVEIPVGEMREFDLNRRQSTSVV